MKKIKIELTTGQTHVFDNVTNIDVDLHSVTIYVRYEYGHGEITVETRYVNEIKFID